MTTAFLDNIQVDEFGWIITDELMFDSYDDDWESLTESNQEEWILVQH